MTHKKLRPLALLLLLLVAGGIALRATHTQRQSSSTSPMKEIYLAGGCFWGTEHFFKQVRGVVSTEVGYANGHTSNPTYEEVCSHTTGFAETVHITYAPDQITLDKLLELYFLTIDPTSLNRQGGDVGDQYRTGIYYTDSTDHPFRPDPVAAHCHRSRATALLLRCRELPSGLSGQEPIGLLPYKS